MGSARFRRQIAPALAAAVLVVGVGRIGFFYLVHEPLLSGPVERVGAQFEDIRSRLRGVSRVAYLSDEPLDLDPVLPRRFDRGDMMYAQAQYALAPTVLAPRGREETLVLANFALGTSLDQLIASGGYLVLARPGPTIALLSRR